jgi:hypothetical protein
MPLEIDGIPLWVSLPAYLYRRNGSEYGCKDLEHLSGKYLRLPELVSIPWCRLSNLE